MGNDMGHFLRPWEVFATHLCHFFHVAGKAKVGRTAGPKLCAELGL